MGFYSIDLKKCQWANCKGLDELQSHTNEWSIPAQAHVHSFLLISVMRVAVAILRRYAYFISIELSSVFTKNSCCNLSLSCRHQIPKLNEMKVSIDEWLPCACHRENPKRYSDAICNHHCVITHNTFHFTELSVFRITVENFRRQWNINSLWAWNEHWTFNAREA